MLRECNRNAFNGARYMGQYFGNIGAQAVVKIVRAGEYTNRSIRNSHGVCRQDFARVYQQILDNPDGGSQPDASRGASERPDQLQKQVEVLGQERIKLRERLRVGISTI